MRDVIMEIKYKIWVERDGNVLFGKGRYDLLKAIDECKSLQAAAKSLNMSYRAAWGRLKASEERLGINLVETQGPGKGMRLTEEARIYLNEFVKLEHEIEILINRANVGLTCIKSNRNNSKK
jgi:molybdate transport system regulatory protein